MARPLAGTAGSSGCWAGGDGGTQWPRADLAGSSFGLALALSLNPYLWLSLRVLGAFAAH